jgi:cell division septal protein FtsQ
VTEFEQIEFKKPERNPVKRWGIYLMIPLVITIIVIVVFSWRWRDALGLQHIVINGNRIIPTQQILTLMDIPFKSPLYKVDIYDVRQRILQQPFVKMVCINRHFPDAIHAQIVEREPIATVNTSQLRYVDEEALLLPQIETAVQLDLPIISRIDGLEKAHIGEVISSPELSEAIKLLQTAQRIDTAIYHLISEVNMNSGKDIILFSTDVGVPVLIGRGEYEKKLILFQSFWNNFVKSQNTNKLQYIDLRFNEQVVVKWKQDSLQPNTVL